MNTNTGFFANFFSDIKNSLYNPFYYRGLKDRNIKSSFKFFFTLVSLLSVILAFGFRLELSMAFSSDNLKSIAGYYPKELVVTIKDGNISTNVEEPYIFKNTFTTRTKSSHNNLFVIDTKNSFTPDLFKQYDTKVLLGKNFIVVEKSPGKFEMTDTSGMPNFSLSQQKIFDWTDVAYSHHRAISTGIFFAVFLAFWIYFVAKLSIFLLFALIVLWFGKIKNMNFSYKNSYQIVLHASIVSIIIQAIIILLGVSVPFPFFSSLIVLTIAYINIRPSESLPMIQDTKDQL